MFRYCEFLNCWEKSRRLIFKLFEKIDTLIIRASPQGSPNMVYKVIMLPLETHPDRLAPAACWLPANHSTLKGQAAAAATYKETPPPSWGPTGACTVLRVVQ